MTAAVDQRPRWNGNCRHLEFTLRGIKFLDDRIANPAYALLLLSGLLMVWVGQLSLTTLWIGASIALWVVLLLVGALAYTPALRNQILVLEKDGADSPEFRRLSARARTAGLALMVLVLTIELLMVLKPGA